MAKNKLANSGGIKPLNAPRTIHVRIDSAGNPTSIQIPPTIDSPRARRTSNRKRRNAPTIQENASGPIEKDRSNRVAATTTSNARNLRRNATPAENLLWKHLRKTQIQKYKFTRQYPIGPYIVDFCCRVARLIIELDGGHHATQQRADIVRQQDLEEHGYRVIRFWNNEVFENIEGVLFRVVEELEHRSLASNPHPSPLPPRERGQNRHTTRIDPPSLQGRELEGGFSRQRPTMTGKRTASPTAQFISDGKWMKVVEIENLWKVNDEWWRGPDEEIARLYYVLRLESGQQLTVYLDLTTNDWYRQAG